MALLVWPPLTVGLDERDVELRSAPLLGPETRSEASEEETAQFIRGGPINNLRVIDEFANAAQSARFEHATA